VMIVSPLSLDTSSSCQFMLSLILVVFVLLQQCLRYFLGVQQTEVGCVDRYYSFKITREATCSAMACTVSLECLGNWGLVNFGSE
jgi:hypothetical protein